MQKRKRIEDIFSSITHAAGFGLSIAALVLLIVWTTDHGSARQVTAVSLFGAALVLLYLASTLYHSLKGTQAGGILQLIDRSAIYVLIAGTYTPFTLIALGGGWGWSLFGVIWGLALTGIVLVGLSVRKFPLLTCVLYLAMGWLLAIAIVPVLQRLPAAGIVWLLAGGMLYSVGVLFFLSRRFLAHTAWHLMVLGGSACHVLAVYAVLQ